MKDDRIRLLNISWVIFVNLLILITSTAGENTKDITIGRNVIKQRILSRMVLVPGGTFLMGSENGDPNERPIHQVTVPSFYLSPCLITCREYQAFLRDNPEWLREHRVKSMPADDHRWRRCYLHNWDGIEYPDGHGDLPVTGIDWEAANAFSLWIGGRLPTEAEWEYAARGGLEQKDYPWGDEINVTKANYRGDRDYIKPYVLKERNATPQIVVTGRDLGATLSPCGKYPPNAYGIYDMAGNAWEWVQDWYGKNYYRVSPEFNPQGPPDGEFRLIRGGSYIDFRFNLRCATRYFVVDGWNVGRLVGFRVAMSVEDYANASAEHNRILIETGIE